MGLTVNTNIAALNAYRNLSSTQGSLSKSLEKLSSGYRINRAADDAAGLAISEGLKSQVGGLTVAARNAQDGISVVQTAEGSLTEVHSILQRLRDLSVQASNDSNNDKARANIKTEATSLVDELSRIAQSTNFNGTKLLDGTAGAAHDGKLQFQVGADGDANSAIQVDLSAANVATIAASLNFGTTSVDARGVAAATVTANLAASWQFGQGTTQVTIDADATVTSASQLVTKLNADAGFSQNFNAALDDDGNLIVTSKSDSTDAITVATDVATPGTYVDLTTTDESVTVGFDSHAAAQAAIGLIDTQIGLVSTARANLGAYQNRFEHTINSVNVAIENLSASESRIADTDMASEMVNFTRAQILQQAGTAMLAQANQLPQSVLKLLQ